MLSFNESEKKKLWKAKILKKNSKVFSLKGSKVKGHLFILKTVKRKCIAHARILKIAKHSDFHYYIKCTRNKSISIHHITDTKSHWLNMQERNQNLNLQFRLNYRMAITFGEEHTFLVCLWCFWGSIGPVAWRFF